MEEGLLDQLHFIHLFIFTTIKHAGVGLFFSCVETKRWRAS